MNKKEVKNILMSLRTRENEAKINNILGKIDMMSEQQVEEITIKMNNSEEKIREFISKKLNEHQEQNRESDKHFPINEMYTYRNFR